MRKTDVMEFLNSLEGGVLVEALGNIISDVGFATRNVDSRVKGKIVLTLNFDKLNDNQLMIDHKVVEIALAHKNLNTIKIDYDKAEYVSQRRELLQWWSDFIDKCDTKENNERALKEAGISLI